MSQPLPDLSRLLSLQGIDEQQISAELFLREYVKLIWPVVEPSRPLEWNWHIDCICDHLDAVYPLRQLRYLVINVPPGFMKSLLVSVAWTTHAWVIDPSLRWLALSGSEKVALRDSLKARDIVVSDTFQRYWGHKVQLREDQNEKARFENTAKGFRSAQVLGGKVTGDRGDGIVIDDPIDAEEANSDARRDVVNRIMRESLPSRLNDQRTGFVVMIMQRLHKHDPTAVMLEWPDVHHLVLPMRWEPPIYIEGTDLRKPKEPQPHDDCEIAVDPRTEPGELIFPGMFPEEAIQALEARLGPYAAAGQLQQRPTTREGILFNESMFLPLPDGFSREGKPVIQFWDWAMSEKQTADYTVAVTAVLDGKRRYIVDMFRGRIGVPDLGTPQEDPTNLAMTMARVIVSQKARLVGIEKPAFRQKTTEQLIRILRRILIDLHYTSVKIVPVEVNRDKVERAYTTQLLGLAGDLYVDRTKPWWNDFLNEHIDFPHGEHDDIVDATSGVLALALEVPSRAGPVPQRVNLEWT